MKAAVLHRFGEPNDVIRARGLMERLQTIATGISRVGSIVGGAMLPGNMQELRSGLQPGEQVVANALVFQNTVEH